MQPLSLPKRMLSPSSLLCPQNPKKTTHSERGIPFSTGDTFFRPESSTARDLAVLAAFLHRSTLSSHETSFRVLDAMCGCGVRSVRYLLQSHADFVHSNDACEDNRPVILDNLGRVDRFASGGERRWMVSHNDASRVMLESYLSREYFDLIDVDSFGSDSGFVRSAVLSVRDGGLLYLTSTDGFSSGGHRPYNSLAAYGAYIRPMPYSNEVGLRMLIGGALREAIALGFQVLPLFSYYSYHGPIFRVMLQVSRGKFHKNSHYGFICYCNKCGHSQSIPWGELGKISCPCKHEMTGLTAFLLKSKIMRFLCQPVDEEAQYKRKKKRTENGHFGSLIQFNHLINNWLDLFYYEGLQFESVSGNFIISGPLWTGPLHDTSFVTDMLNLARDWRWANTKETGVDLEKLLKQMIDESHPNLPSGYIELDEISKRGKINSPPINTLIDSLQKEGYAVSRSHIKPNAIKTNCPMSVCIQIARDLYQPSPSQPALHSP